MINIEPQSDVKLLKTPLEKDSEHTLSFTSLSDQTSYFLSKVEYSFTDFTYVREYQELTVPKSYDEICTCNYLMYRNTGFNTKYFYAFITKMEFVNENMTRIYFEIDSLQTWYFQINYNQVFIEREHVSDDTIGLHTIPENVEIGDYVEESQTTGENVSFNYLVKNGPSGSGPIVRTCYVVLGVTTPGYFAVPGATKQYNGVYSGLYYLIFETMHDADVYIRYIQTELSQDNIVSVFMVPEQFYPDPDFITTTEGRYTFSWAYFPYSTESVTLTTPYCNKTNYLGNNYVPKNKKLLTYPYKYFVVSNNAGQSSVYKYEYFSGANECTFDIKGAITPGCSIKLIPKNYHNRGKNILYCLDGPKLPTCSWINDTYTNWLTANSVNIALSLVEDTAKIATVAGGNVAGAVSGAQGIASTISQVYEMSKMPPTAKGGVNTGDCLFGEKMSFSLHKNVIKEEYAKIVDNYFDLYGYKVNRLKLPELYSRRNWNYIKTIGCNFTGDIPQQDMEKIKSIFNNGITFWHNANNYLDYSANNDII